jgi:glycerophosphoryl diester phosphodiesterase
MLVTNPAAGKATLPVPSPPILVAHRGHAAVCPENTIVALDSAVAAGARWLEVDIQLTGDGLPVLLHDADLERTAGQPAAVFGLTAASLAAIPVGEPARFGTRYADARAPTLAEFVRWLEAQSDVEAFIEIKPQSLERFGHTAVVTACLQALAPVAERVVPISFDFEALAMARAAGARRLGWIVRGYSEAVSTGADALGARWLFINHERLPPGPLPTGPWEWVPYEVGTVALAKDLIDRGAHWLETMAIEELGTALGAR